jgi:hypothetical protein
VIGNKLIRLIATRRDLELLERLSEAKILDREQVQIIAGIRRINRANDRLGRLYAAGLIRRHFQGTAAGGRKAIYSLSNSGAKLIGRERSWRFQHADGELLIGDSFTAHQTAVNWVWVSAKYRCSVGVDFLRWINFQEPLTPTLSIIPDGYFEFGFRGEARAQFIEVDLGTESSKAWEHKTEQYLKLATSGEFTRLFGQPRFRVLVTAPSMRRLQNIRAVVRKQTSKIFFFCDHSIIYRDGLFTPLWLRPQGEERHSLI